jgi:exo-1,4-beta-D-glucosaminidase
VNRSTRPPLAVGISFALAVTSLMWLAPGAQAIPAATVPAPGGAAAPVTTADTALTSPPSPGSTSSPGSPPGAGPPTGASNVSDLGAHGWRVASSADAAQSGAQISTPGFNANSWLRVANDGAGAPGTEVEALLQNGRCPDDPALQPVNQSSDSRHSIFFSDIMRKCYGYMDRIGPDTVARFDVPWWWRADFTPHLRAGQHATLIVNGVIGSASVWVNGHQLATSKTVTGMYTRFTFGISKLVRPGTNSLAIEVNPNDPGKMFTVDDVDWNQIPPDNNTGIVYPVQLAVDKALSDSNAHVLEHNTASLGRSRLTVKTNVTNSTGKPQTGLVTATITAPNGHQGLGAGRRVTVPANSTKTVVFTGLTLHHPQVWWPYQLGAQPLYRLVTSVSQHGATLNTTQESFGIRNVASYLTGSSPAEPPGARAFKINGVPLVIRGGGWSPNLFLHYSAADTARQIALMKNMGVNTIRLEGHIMPANFFQQMDQAGILVNAGYQCCDGWQLQQSHLTSPADFKIIRLSALTIGQNLRNHPSVFSFQWSDAQPTRKQEAVSLAAFRQADFQDPIISSAEYNRSAKLGWSGEKEGPYDWVPPSYWYSSHYDAHDSTQTNAGGAWGYDSEESAGDTIPTLDSLRRFSSAAELSNLWRSPRYNQYHLNYEPRCGRGYTFGTLCWFDKALRARYGAWHSLRQYVEEAQAQDYEDTRAQFEAFIDHAHHGPIPSTGTIYWQMNKGWPSLLWNLYGSDGDQAGSYFGTQEANRPLHALYALDNGTVTVDNLGGRRQSGLSVQAKVYSLTGKVLYAHTVAGISLASQQVRTQVMTPKVPAGKAARVYFVELQLRRQSGGGRVARGREKQGALIDRNVYWLSTRRDAVSWRRTLDRPQGIMTRYADLRPLQTLPTSRVSVTTTTARRSGPDGANLTTKVTIRDTSASAVAFLLRADVRRGTRSGHELPGDNELQTSIWRDNDITLFPGQSQTLTVSYDSASLRGATPVISVSGWNVPKIDVPAPVR